MVVAEEVSWRLGALEEEEEGEEGAEKEEVVAQGPEG